MKYKEFVNWCNDRACDGCWGMNTAKYCISIIMKIDSQPFWRRNKIWKKNFEQSVVENVVKPINKEMKTFGII